MHKKRSARSFVHPAGVMDVRALGSWMSAPKCLFSKNSRVCLKFLTRDVSLNDPQMSARYPSRKLSLWAVFLPS